jgi:hypothetical protein
MSKIIETIQSLPNLLPLKPATNAEIADAELQLGISFAQEYKEYLRAFGVIMADGIELTGIAKAAHRNVVAVTKQERELDGKIPDSMYVDSMYVIESAGVDGIVIRQDASGVVYQSSPNKPPMETAKSLDDYIGRRNNHT